MTVLDYLIKFAEGVFSPTLATQLINEFTNMHPELRKPPLDSEQSTIDGTVDAYMKAKYPDAQK